LDFSTVLGVVSDFLEERGFRYAVIGGVALATYVLHRTTLDLDLVVDSSAQDDLIRFLEAHGYQTRHRSTGYSNHSHPDPRWGNLDFVYIGGETSRSLFAALRTLAGPREIMIPLPKPEHLAALKVLAMKNEPDRTFQDMADIRFLMNLPGVDRREIKRHFERHGLGSKFDEL
jgi:hypothetical protein